MRTPPVPSLAIAAVALGALLLPSPAQARCMSSKTWVWPAPDTPLPAEARIAVVGYGTDQHWVRDLAARDPELVDGDERVPLEVVDIQEGELRLTRAVLVPVRPLTPGRTYVLEMDKDGTHAPLSTGLRRAIARWPVEDRRDAPPLRWGAPPEVTDSTYMFFGCGPASYVHVAVPLTGGSGPVVVRATVRPLDESGADAGAEATRYELQIEDGAVRIGHGMCSGAFRLRLGARYAVTLEAVDQAGRAVAAPGGELIVVGPRP